VSFQKRQGAHLGADDGAVGSEDFLELGVIDVVVKVLNVQVQVLGFQLAAALLILAAQLGGALRLLLCANAEELRALQILLVHCLNSLQY
jgi:hypothetical protein